jgi:hypothetical protein
LPEPGVCPLLLLRRFGQCVMFARIVSRRPYGEQISANRFMNTVGEKLNISA